MIITIIIVKIYWSGGNNLHIGGAFTPTSQCIYGCAGAPLIVVNRWQLYKICRVAICLQLLVASICVNMFAQRVVNP